MSVICQALPTHQRSRNFALVLCVAFLLLAAGCAGPEAALSGEQTDIEKRGPMSLVQLEKHRFDTTLRVEGPLVGGLSFSAHLVSYRHAGLKLYALVAVPKSPAPTEGYPVVVANHGYVPQPPNYGVTKEGLNHRPGDYYRSVPELYASRGFLVVMPDYRGHNASEGYEYIDPQDDDAVGYYAEDVVALMAGLTDIAGADTRRVFMWSHSMGGPVALRTLLATNVVKAAAFWSTMPLDEHNARLPELGGPITIHHSARDTATAHENSARMSAALKAQDLPHEFYSYAGGEHFFSVRDRHIAADRDVALFLSF